MEQNNMSGYSSSSDETESNRINYGQDFAHSAPSVNLQSALVTPIRFAQSTGVLPNPTVAAPSPTLLLPPPPRREPISPIAGLVQTQQGHQINSNNRNQVSFPSEVVSDGERMINQFNPGTTATLVQLPIPQFLATPGNGNIGPSIHRPQWANRHLQNNQLALVDPSSPNFGQQELRMQGAMGPDIASPNLQPSVSSHPLQMRMGAPMANLFPFQPEVVMLSNHNSNQMRINGLDNIPPAPPIQQVQRNPPEQNFLIPALPDPRYPQNIGLYDPLYETIGLPVDPHLRAFLAWRNAGRD